MPYYRKFTRPRRVRDLLRSTAFTTAPPPPPPPPPPPGPAGPPVLERVELVTNQALYADGGNTWGSNKLRIARTSTGDIYTTYVVAGADGNSKLWRLMKRPAAGGWSQTASGVAGREPPNLLVGPDNKIYLTTYQGGSNPQLHTSSDGVNFTMEQILPAANWVPGHATYHAASISTVGDIFVIRTNIDSRYKTAWRIAGSGTWNFVSAEQNSYGTVNSSYAFPVALGGASLNVIATTDNQWANYGYTAPPGAYAYLLNEIDFSSPTNAATLPWPRIIVRKELPSQAGGAVAEPRAFGEDGYRDTAGRYHVCYQYNGALGNGQRHAVVEGGAVMADVVGPTTFWDYGRMVEDSAGKLYWMNSNGNNIQVHPSTNANGTTLAAPINLNVGRSIAANPASLWLASPRGGTPVGDFVEGVFASGAGTTEWWYFRIKLRS